MNKQIFFAVCLACFQTAHSAVAVRVADPNTLLPLPGSEIVLGQSAALVIYSDANQPWQGGLFIREADRERAVLRGRGEVLQYRNYPDSCLAQAGDFPRALRWEDSVIEGFDFYTDDVQTSPGDWFVVDYVPLTAGLCTIEFYDYVQEDPNCWANPVSTFVLENTPSRDFTGNGLVNLEDYAQLASYWLWDNCGEPDWCGQTDLDRDGAVALTDLVMFSEYWLWGMPGWKPAPPPEDPNVFYTLTDGQGLAEIELPVGESITLYMNKTTLEKDVYIFHLEAMISDTDLGWIDNTPIDPNNPPGEGTARILASPRMSAFDYWGPGQTQSEGIQCSAANIGSPIEDGQLASFVYTATAAGDVTLSLRDYGSIPSSLSGILIHQTDSMESMSMSTGGDLQTLSTSDSVQSESIETTTYTTEETVELLQDIWEEEPDLRQTVGQEQWDAFIESVEESAQ